MMQPCQVGEIRVPADYFDEIERLLQTREVYEKAHRNGVIEIFSYDFGRHYEADIKICNSEEGPYIDPVLFFHGCETNVGEVGSSLTSEFPFEDPATGRQFLVRLVRVETAGGGIP